MMSTTGRGAEPAAVPRHAAAADAVPGRLGAGAPAARSSSSSSSISSGLFFPRIAGGQLPSPGRARPSLNPRCFPAPSAAGRPHDRVYLVLVMVRGRRGRDAGPELIFSSLSIAKRGSRVSRPEDPLGADFATVDTRRNLSRRVPSRRAAAPSNFKDFRPLGRAHRAAESLRDPRPPRQREKRCTSDACANSTLAVVADVRAPRVRLYLRPGRRARDVLRRRAARRCGGGATRRRASSSRRPRATPHQLRHRPCAAPRRGARGGRGFVSRRRAENEGLRVVQRPGPEGGGNDEPFPVRAARRCTEEGDYQHFGFALNS